MQSVMTIQMNMLHADSNILIENMNPCVLINAVSKLNMIPMFKTIYEVIVTIILLKIMPIPRNNNNLREK